MRSADRLSADAIQKLRNELNHIHALARACDLINDVVHVHRMSSTDGGVHITVHRDDESRVKEIMDDLGFSASQEIGGFSFFTLCDSTLFVQWRTDA